jgi:hypothetical protein
MLDSDCHSPSLGGLDAEGTVRPPAPALPMLSCAVSKILFVQGGVSPNWEYSPANVAWNFADVSLSDGPIVLRNSVFHAGEVFAVESVSSRALERTWVSALCISRNVAHLGEACLTECWDLQIVAFEGDSHLSELSVDAFAYCKSLRSIAIPPLVALLGECCFAYCQSLQSVMFERPSRIATIGASAFWFCFSLDWFSIPASVTEMDGSAFTGSRIRSVGIEEGSTSFRVVNELLVDFEVRSLVLAIGSPESIVIPSTIETLGQFCFCWNDELRTVEFESDSILRSIGHSAFLGCKSLESICIPSSVEVLPEGCFENCWGLRTVTFGADSELRAIEETAFCDCRSLEFVSVPASVEFIGRQLGCSASLPSPQSHWG